MNIFDQGENAVFRGTWKAVLFLLPTILILIVFLYFPAWHSLVMSFFRNNLFLGTHTFIGLGNYRNLFTGPLAPAFLQSLTQTLLISLLIVFIGISASIFLAIQANKKIKGGTVYRMLLIWPFALSPAVAGTIFLFIFNPEVGIMNTLLDFLFSVKPRWLDSPLLALTLVVFAAVWKYLGYNIVFYLAALQNIPTEPLEAADIDGAGAWRKFFNVLYPLLSPTTFFLVFTNISYAFFETFGLIDILTTGGPVGPPTVLDKTGITTTLMYKVFQDGFGGSSNMGFAAAESVILTIMVGVVAYFQFSSMGKGIHYQG
ncbi:carbohydrate ABC transporter permease [Sediminispirochaeta bajacaliforniensis]|uniref:carbohydrate ABC transporter permease n=1 Tax=Sediminispirochaeta bajacaliforniensis TaxID=148 RepID=UPI000373BD38|nr:sugar ABC transporter permease [Sediminispirochaeta bajacaliforniensis]